MSLLRTLTLKSQVLVAATFLALVVLGTGLAYRHQSRAISDLAQSMDQDLGILVELPSVRERLRQTDQLTDQYLLTGNPLWVKQRKAVVNEIHDRVGALSLLLSEKGEGPVAKQLGDALTVYLTQQDRWIERKTGGQLSAKDSARIAARKRGFDEIADLVLSVSDTSVADLRARRLAVRQASNAALGLILGAGLFAAALGTMFLTRYVVQPVVELERQAGAWQLGQPWTYTPRTASPEIRSLASHMEQVAARMNKQYSHELELSGFKSQLVAIVSHEFNNALNILVGVSTLLEDSEGSGPTDRRKEYYQMLKSNLRMLTIASSNLLNMGRLESGRFAVTPRKADAGKLLRESSERLAILAQQKQQTVALELASSLPPVSADPEALTLVVANLLSNAIKYTPENGRISLGAFEESGGRVRVVCRDSGIGISAADRERIFTEYYRSEAGQKMAKGYGVGLSLAKRILEAHGTELELESEPGKGSTFSFRLPVWKDS